jgi:hypothetical protein
MTKMSNMHNMHIMHIMTLGFCVYSQQYVHLYRTVVLVGTVFAHDVGFGDSMPSSAMVWLVKNGDSCYRWCQRDNFLMNVEVIPEFFVKN